MLFLVIAVNLLTPMFVVVVTLTEMLSQLVIVYLDFMKITHQIVELVTQFIVLLVLVILIVILVSETESLVLKDLKPEILPTVFVQPIPMMKVPKIVFLVQTNVKPVKS